MGAKLLPPIIEGKIPAQFGDTLKIPFQHSRGIGPKEFSGLMLKIKSTSTGQQINLIKNDNITINSNIAEFKILNNNLVLGQYYKIQLAYISNDMKTIGYYSTIGIFKYTAYPKIYIQNSSGDLNVKEINTNTFVYTGIYEQENEPTEKVYSYRFDIYKGKELYETSGDLIHKTEEDSSTSNSFDTYTFTKELEENVHYNIQYTVRTNNDLIISSPKYIITKMGEKNIHMNMEIIIPNIESDSLEEAEQARLNKEEGYFTIGIKFFENTNIMGTFRVLRANSLTNFQVWEEMKQFKIDDHIMQNNILWLFDDFTVQHGVEYKYALQQISNNIYSKRKESNNTVLCDFTDTFLYDGKRQLKIQFNPKVSSYKNVLLESKLDTIGGKKPFIFRNARTNYKEIPISGLISYLMDDNQMFMTDKELLLGEETSRYSTEAEQKYTNQMKQRIRSTDLTSENILSERLFKNEVLEWLTNGQPKLFRSPTEGNYIIRLLNVSLSPNDTLGRMLHTFTATGYEIAEMNYENLTKLNFITAKENNEIQLVNNSHQYNYKFDNFISGSELSFEPTIYARFSNMAPGSSFKLTFNNNETLDIQIGLTGYYEIAQSGLISIKALNDIKEGNLEIAVKNSQLLNEIIENFNGKDYKLVSIEAKDYYRQFVSNYDLINYKPADGFGKINDIAVNLSFNTTEEKETKIIKKQLQAIPYLKIESRLINIVPDNTNKLKTSFYITDNNEDFLSKDYFKSLYFYQIKRGENEPTSYYLDYAIIEGVSYTIPQRIPNGYISFGIEDFEIMPEENIEITLGPGVYADIIYRVLEETYELIDTQIIEKIKEE